MTKKRNKLEVVHDILEVIRSKNGRIKPTHIMYKSNLSYQMMEEYLTELIEKGFITEVNGNNGKVYRITEKGLEYLNKFKFIIEFTNTFGLNF
jgi:predicted transcriptional regulator